MKSTTEIVRCKDCKHFAVDQSDHEYRSGLWCKWWGTDLARPDKFCAWGESVDPEHRPFGGMPEGEPIVGTYMREV